MARVDFSCNGVNHLSGFHQPQLLYHTLLTYDLRPPKAGNPALNPGSPLDSNVLVGLEPTCLMPSTFSLCRDGFVAEVLLLRYP